MDEADQAMKDIERRVRDTGRAEQPGRASDSDQRTREPLPTQQIWAHDARPGSVKGGQTYQFRVRAVIFNRLAGYPERFRDVGNAQVVWIPGEWSDPVEVKIEPSALSFLVSKDVRNEQVSIELYQWFEGVWVKTRPKFGVGDSLALEQRCKVPPLDPNDSYDLALVPFAVDATVVDIDFDRVYRERKRGSGRSGVRFGPQTSACSVVFADSAGRLYERFVPTDKDNPAKRAAADREWSPPK
jgi:hypothetical protein